MMLPSFVLPASVGPVSWVCRNIVFEMGGCMELTIKTLSGTRILCADDSPDSLELLRIILVREGAQVTACDSAEAAIVTLVDEQFDVVISDLSMPPGLDGYDLVHALRRMEDENPDRQATPTIAVSGDAMRSSRKRRYADFQVYMPKPVNRTRLLYIVERLVEASGDAVKFGSLGGWEAERATEAAIIATDVAANATAAASEATIAATNARAAAVDATAAAVNAKVTAFQAEMNASAASAQAPNPP